MPDSFMTVTMVLATVICCVLFARASCVTCMSRRPYGVLLCRELCDRERCESRVFTLHNLTCTLYNDTQPRKSQSKQVGITSPSHHTVSPKIKPVCRNPPEYPLYNMISVSPSEATYDCIQNYFPCGERLGTSQCQPSGQWTDISTTFVCKHCYWKDPPSVVNLPQCGDRDQTNEFTITITGARRAKIHDNFTIPIANDSTPQFVVSLSRNDFVPGPVPFDIKVEGSKSSLIIYNAFFERFQTDRRFRITNAGRHLQILFDVAGVYRFPTGAMYVRPELLIFSGGIKVDSIHWQTKVSMSN